MEAEQWDIDEYVLPADLTFAGVPTQCQRLQRSVQATEMAVAPMQVRGACDHPLSMTIA